MDDPYSHLSDEQKRSIGKAFREDNLEMRRQAHQAAIDYGKWTIATLFAVNAAITFAIRDDLNSSADGWLVVGMFAGVLLSGLSAWANWGLIASMYDKCSSPNLAIGIQYYVRPESNRWISVTHWLSLLFGIGSGVCAAIAVLTIFVPEVTA
ncbi:MAG: hypothetical protein AAF739_09875 [Pseudomonadota bacterium]